MCPLQDTPLRAAPPAGLLSGPGPETGTALTGRGYRVLDRRRIQAGVGTQRIRVEIAPVAPGGLTPQGPSAWAYCGDTDGAGSPDFAARPAVEE